MTILKCGHCGAGNSVSAKFCAKCAVRLRSPVAGSTDRSPRIATPESDIQTIIQIEPSAAKERDTTLQPARHELPYQPVPPPPAILLEKEKGALRKKRSPIIVASIAFVTFGSALAWWSVGSHPTTQELRAPIAGSAPASSAAVALMPSKKVEPAPIAVLQEPVRLASTPADIQPDDRKTRARLANSDNAKIRREALARRKSDNEAAKRAAVANAVRAQAAERVRTSTSPNTKDELPRPAKLKPMLQTPQQACADRSNFISRGICESRECEKPERATLKFCIDMHERRAPHD